MDASNNTLYSATNQLFFDEAVTAYIYTNIAPYNTRNNRDTDNAADRVFSSAVNIPLVVSGSYATGLAASVPIFYPFGEAGVMGTNIATTGGTQWVSAVALLNATSSSSSSTGTSASSSGSSTADSGDFSGASQLSIGLAAVATAVVSLML